MIHYRLVCEAGHDFESWFKNSQTFDLQAHKGLINCPYCQSTKITRGVMAPHVAKIHDDQGKKLRELVTELRNKLIDGTEDVGDQFPKEARKMEDGEVKLRPIRGRATFEEAKALLEEGIQILPIPDAPGEGN